MPSADSDTHHLFTRNTRLMVCVFCVTVGGRFIIGPRPTPKLTAIDRNLLKFRLAFVSLFRVPSFGSVVTLSFSLLNRLNITSLIPGPPTNTFITLMSHLHTKWMDHPWRLRFYIRRHPNHITACTSRKTNTRPLCCSRYILSSPQMNVCVV